MFFYNGYRARKLMYFIKDNTDKEAIRFIAELAADSTGLKMSTFDGIAYVPRLPRRARRYGYDQSKELANALSRIYGIPVIHALKRVGGREQKLLSASERRKNIVGRYKLRLDRDMTVRYKRILLVDDIYTTGATIKECKRLLLDSVADSVVPLTLAKTNLLKK
jgi:competence protein ComFC